MRLEILVGIALVAGVVYALRRKSEVPATERTTATPAPTDGNGKDEKKPEKTKEKKKEKEKSYAGWWWLLVVVVIAVATAFDYHRNKATAPSTAPQRIGPWVAMAGKVVQLGNGGKPSIATFQVAEQPMQVEVIGCYRVSWVTTCPIRVLFNDGREIIDRPGLMQPHIPSVTPNNLFRINTLEGCVGEVTFTLTPRSFGE